MNNILKSVSAMLAALAIALGAHAPNAVAAQSEARAPVLSGGVGEGERAQLAQQARGYNLKLVFTLSSGNYVAEVPFQIMRSGKAVVDETAKGPWAFVKLAPGQYTVKATYEGKAQSKQVDVPRSGQKRVSFVWRASERVADQPQSGER